MSKFKTGYDLAKEKGWTVKTRIAAQSLHGVFSIALYWTHQGEKERLITTRYANGRIHAWLVASRLHLDARRYCPTLPKEYNK